jgi:hypothetical protein
LFRSFHSSAPYTATFICSPISVVCTALLSTYLKIVLAMYLMRRYPSQRHVLSQRGWTDVFIFDGLSQLVQQLSYRMDERGFEVRLPTGVRCVDRWRLPCGGGIAYLHHSTASHRRRQRGSLESDTVKYSRKSHGTRTREWLRWRGPAAIVNDRLILSSERMLHKDYDRRCSIEKKKFWPWVSRGSASRWTDWWLTATRKVNLTLTVTRAYPVSRSRRQTRTEDSHRPVTVERVFRQSFIVNCCNWSWLRVIVNEGVNKSNHPIQNPLFSSRGHKHVALLKHLLQNEWKRCWSQLINVVSVN